MIARAWTGRTRVEDAETYAAYLERTGVRELAGTEGNLGVFMLRRAERREAEFTILSLWRSLEDVRRFAGPSPERARYFPEDHRFLLEMPERVIHYDVLLHAEARQS